MATAMTQLVLTCFLFFCGVSSEQRQNGDYVIKLCRRPAAESVANELHHKPHEKTHNDILVDPVCEQCDTNGQRSSDAKQFLRPSQCREETNAIDHGNVGETTNVSALDYSVILSNRRTSSNVADIGTNHRSENDGHRFSISMDLPIKAYGRTRTYRVPGPLHDPLWFVDSDAVLPSRPAMHWSECLEGAYLWVIALLGGVTNAAVLATCACSRRRLRPLHVLVASLAAADLLVSCVYVPTYTYLLVDVPASRITDSDRRVCHFARAVFVLAASASLSIKDLIAIYFRLMIGSRRWRHRIFRHTPLLALIAWLLNAAVVFAPCVAGFPHVDLYPNAFVCGQPSNDTQTHWWIQTEQSYYPTTVLVYYLIVLAVHLLQVGITFVCFVEVHTAILSGRRMCKLKLSEVENKKIKHRYRRASRITGLVFASCVLCWLPLYVVSVVDPSHTHLPTSIHHAVIDLFLLKSALHPLIYMTGLRSLRLEMKLMCMCRCRDKKGTQAQFLIARTSDLTGISDSIETLRLLERTERAV